MTSAFQSFKTLSPIFIGGQWRSGTTLLQRLLDGHPNLLVYPFEESIVYRFLYNHAEFDFLGVSEGLLNQDAGKIYYSLIKNSNLCSALEKQIDTWGRTLGDLSPNVAYLGLNNFVATGIDKNLSQKYFIEGLSSIRTSWTIYDVLIAWMYSYFSACGIQDFSNYVGWVTKTPGDLGQCICHYQATFSNCRIIHVVRDPRAFWISAKLVYGARRDAKENPSVSISQNISSLLEEFEERKGLFKRQLEAIRHEDLFLLIRYEDLVQQTEVIMNKVSRFLGVSFDSVLTNSSFKGEPWNSNSSFSVGKALRGVISLDSLDRWKKLIRPHEQLLIEGAAGNELLTFGYLDKVRFQVFKGWFWFWTLSATKILSKLQTFYKFFTRGLLRILVSLEGRRPSIFE